MFNSYINYEWAILNSYVKLPEGRGSQVAPQIPKKGIPQMTDSARIELLSHIDLSLGHVFWVDP